MSKLPLLIIFIILLLFIEYFLNFTGGLSIVLVLLLIGYRRIDSIYFIVPIITVSLALDVTNHILTGSTLVVMLVVLTIYLIGTRYLPYDQNILVKVLFLIVLFALFHLIYTAVSYIGEGQGLEVLFSSQNVSPAFRNALIETALFILIEYVSEYLSTSKSSSFRIK